MRWFDMLQSIDWIKCERNDNHTKGEIRSTTLLLANNEQSVEIEFRVEFGPPVTVTRFCRTFDPLGLTTPSDEVASPLLSPGQYADCHNKLLVAATEEEEIISTCD